MSKQFPWNQKPLDVWSIVGMNHYKNDETGQRNLYVAMTKNSDGIGVVIKAEGTNETQVFKDLALQAERWAVLEGRG